MEFNCSTKTDLNFEVFYDIFCDIDYFLRTSLSEKVSQRWIDNKETHLLFECQLIRGSTSEERTQN